MTRIGLAVAGIGVAALLTACSGDDGDDGGGDEAGTPPDFSDATAQEIVDGAKSAMADLSSVKISGSVKSDGQDISIDMQSSSEGDCTGSIGIADGSAEILGVGGETWMKPDESFWRTFAGQAADDVLAAVGDKWVVIPADDDSFNQFCDVDELLDELLQDEDDDSTYTKGSTEDLDGQEVVLVDNEDPEDGTSTGYVLVEAPHYLVKIERTEGEDTGSVTFSEFDEDFDVQAPASDDVVDLNSLGG